MVYYSKMSNFWNALPKPFFILAPMEAVTDVVFRHVVGRAGAPDVFFSEFTNATGWVHAGEKAIGGRLLKTSDEHPIVAQIWGGEPGDMEQLAHHCRELGYDGIDINMGCPAKSAVKSGGSALIRSPDLAATSIAAAKTAGLPVSVKTRLGYTYVDEWREWLAHLLLQDIVNLTIHLRTKKEMSKVPAHFELIDEIVALRDELAPHTLLTINGDIRDRAHGLELIAQHPGVNGVMIGRGVFQNPFCFAKEEKEEVRIWNLEFGMNKLESSDKRVARESEWQDEKASKQACADLLAFKTSAQTRELSAESSSQFASCLSKASSGEFEELDKDDSRSAEAVLKANRSGHLISLLRLHLDLFDEHQAQLHRPFETLKRFFKIYIRDFDGASELRDKLMHTKSTDEVRAILQDRL